MEKVGLIPDLILVEPKEVAEIKFGDVAVDQGNEITPTQVKVGGIVYYITSKSFNDALGSSRKRTLKKFEFKLVQKMQVFCLSFRFFRAMF